jgi:hypothetical protein
MGTTPQDEEQDMNAEHTKPITEAVVGSRYIMVKGYGVSPTLNGHSARISGFSNRFATVTDRETGLSAEWSWEAVRIVLANGGAFKS